MIVVLSQFAESCIRNRVWLASLGAAAAINFVLFWLASIAPMGNLPAGDQAKSESPVEIVMRRIVPPPPDVASLAEAPPTALPLRFRPRVPVLQAFPDIRPETIISQPRLRLNLNPCDPADEDKASNANCPPHQEWLRAGRDASDWLGPDAQGMTLDEVAAARGWIKPKPRKGQDALAAQTDTTLPQTIFKDAPFPPHAIEQSGGW